MSIFAFLVRRVHERLRRRILHSRGRLPASDGARITLSGGERLIVDGPFVESKEVVGGYHAVEVATKDEAIAWAKKVPLLETDAIDVRPIWGM